jgi:hypothetical protein
MNNILNLNKYGNAPKGKSWRQSEKSQKDNRDIKITSFSRDELNHILALYGRKVVSGQWKDYAIDTLKDQAIFSIFKQSHEMPQYTIHKLPKLKNSQKMYQIKGTDGKILKRGSELPLILRILDKENSKYKII